MKFSSREDMDAPLEAAFSAVADFDYLEGQILRRGIQIVRVDTQPEPGPGMSWQAEMGWRSQQHDITCDLVGWAPPSDVTMTAVSGGLNCEILAQMTALSRSTTRLRVAMTLRANTFRDRLLVQSLQIAKARLARQFGDMVHAYAQDAARRANA
ncbi:MAG: hypothetical protein HKN02_06305 [Rhodobacteraceae bacterium]|nr:hypothetical protein [Paracoccaceae bacterium]